MTELDVTALVFVGPTELGDKTEQQYTALGASVGTLYIVGNIPASSKIHEQTDITVLNPPWFVPYLLYILLLPLIHNQQCRSLDVVRSTTSQDILSALIISSVWDCCSVVATTPPRTPSERNAIDRWIELAKRIPERLSHIFANAVVSETAVQYLDIEQQHWVRAEHFVLHPTVAIENIRSMPSEDKPVFVDAGTRDHPSTIVPSVTEYNWLLLLASDIQVPNIPDGCRVARVNDNKWTEQVALEKFDLVFLYGEQSIKLTLQAMEAGLPVITTETSKSQELVDDGKDGIIASAESGSVGETIAELLIDASARKVIGDAARKKIQQRYSIKQGVTRELAVYRVMLSQAA